MVKRRGPGMEACDTAQLNCNQKDGSPFQSTHHYLLINYKLNQLRQFSITPYLSGLPESCCDL